METKARPLGKGRSHQERGRKKETDRAREATDGMGTKKKGV